MAVVEGSEVADSPEAAASTLLTAVVVGRVVSREGSNSPDNRTRKTTTTTSAQALETAPRTTRRQDRVVGMKRHHGGRPKPRPRPLHMTSDWNGYARLVSCSLRPSFFFLWRLWGCW